MIYYFHSQNMPAVLMTVFRKNEKADLTPAEKKALRNAVDELVMTLLRRGGRHHASKGARF